MASIEIITCERTDQMEELITEFKKLINTDLPARYTFPVRFNHCFNRIILDWLFSNCWYNHLDRKKTAISQLSETQLESAVKRMNEWLQNQQLLIEDNINSLHYRTKTKRKAAIGNLNTDENLRK